MNILLLYDNGCSADIFNRVVEEAGKVSGNAHQIYIPQLSGHGSKELSAKSEDYFELFLDEIYQVMEGKTTENWLLYGNGTGAAIIMEFAMRQWTFPNGYILHPKEIILHSPIGPNYGRFLMRFPLMRQLRRNWICAKMNRKRQIIKFFGPEHTLSEEQIEVFFSDMKNCQAYSLWYELLDADWYKKVRTASWHQRFNIFLNEKDKSVQTKWLPFWKKDFPKSTVKVMEGWGRFTMLDQPSLFIKTITEYIK